MKINTQYPDNQQNNFLCFFLILNQKVKKIIIPLFFPIFKTWKAA